MTFNPQTFLPPVLAVGSSQGVNGRQQLGSGLVTHRGVIDANSFRASGVLYPQSGAGLELIYFQTPAYPKKNAIVQSYDRDAQAYTDLQLSGQNIVLSPSQGGSVVLPPGTVMPLRGAFEAGSGYVTPQQSVWNESDVRANFTKSLAASLIKVDWSIAFSLNVAAGVGYVYLGIGFDGGTPNARAAITSPGANYGLGWSGTAYWSGMTTGAHRASVMIWPGGCAATLNSGVFQTVYVTEIVG